MTDTLTNGDSTTSPYEEALAKAPAWLNLPALLSEGMVLDIAGKADEAEALAAAVREAMQSTHRLIFSFDGATRELEGDEVLSILRQITGMDRLWNAVQSIVDDACAGGGFGQQRRARVDGADGRRPPCDDRRGRAHPVAAGGLTLASGPRFGGGRSRSGTMAGTGESRTLLACLPR